MDLDPLSDLSIGGRLEGERRMHLRVEVDEAQTPRSDQSRVLKPREVAKESGELRDVSGEVFDENSSIRQNTVCGKFGLNSNERSC